MRVTALFLIPASAPFFRRQNRIRWVWFYLLQVKSNLHAKF
jgi:hypothetical protein